MERARGTPVRQKTGRLKKGNVSVYREMFSMALRKSDKWLIAVLAAVFLLGTAVLTGGFLLYRAFRKSFAPQVAAEGEGPPLEWERTFTRGDMGRGELVEQTADGGFIVAATVWEEEAGGEGIKVHLLKTGGDGNLVWEAVLDGEGFSDLAAVEECTQGGYFILVNKVEEPAADLFENIAENGEREPAVEKCLLSTLLIKTDDRGNPEWERAMGHDRPCRAGAGRKTGDGGYTIFGSIEEADGKIAYYLVKVDPAGEVEWERSLVPAPGRAEDLPDTMTSIGFSLTPAAEGGYMCISAHPVGGSMAFSIFKTDETGNTLARSACSLEGLSQGCFVADPAPGDGFMVGTNEKLSLLTLFNPSLQLHKIDGSGSLQWEREHRGAGDIGSIASLSDGGWIISTSSFTFYPLPSTNAHLSKIGSSGDLIWKKTFVSTQDDTSGADCYADHVRQTEEGGLIISGMREGKILLLKVAPENRQGVDAP